MERAILTDPDAPAVTARTGDTARPYSTEAAATARGASLRLGRPTGARPGGARGSVRPCAEDAAPAEAAGAIPMTGGTSAARAAQGTSAAAAVEGASIECDATCRPSSAHGPPARPRASSGPTTGRAATSAWTPRLLRNLHVVEVPSSSIAWCGGREQLRKQPASGSSSDAHCTMASRTIV